MSNYHLAQFNVATLRYPLDDPAMESFTNSIASVNEIAKNTPGFIWTYENPDADKPVPGFESPDLLVNMSLWETVEALKDYTYKSLHGQFYKNRKQWFVEPECANYVLWWVEAGDIPDTLEAKRKLELLIANGATAQAFSFARLFPQPG